jgi:hypothetical protein
MLKCIEVDLLIEPNSINIVLPNGMPLLQPIVYESLPRFCKHCRVLGHTDSICTKVGGNKQKKHIQMTFSSVKLHQNSGCSSCVSSVETVVEEQQQVYIMANLMLNHVWILYVLKWRLWLIAGLKSLSLRRQKISS